MADPVVLYEVRGRTALITINRPEARNAVNQEVATLIGDSITKAEKDDAVRAIVITGAGDLSFCAGADLKDVASGRGVMPPGHDRQVWGFAGLTRRVVEKPLIAAVNGYAHGGGFEIALASDLIVAATDAEFKLPEAKRGVIAGGGGVSRGPVQLPTKIAMQLLLTGDGLTGEQLYQWGFVNYLVPRSEVLATALDVAERIASFAPLSIRGTRRAAYRVVGDSIPSEAAAWAISDQEVFDNRRSDDFKEGTRAFAEKREPNWKGR